MRSRFMSSVNAPSILRRDRSRERALKRIQALSKELPLDWKFDRDEANAR